MPKVVIILGIGAFINAVGNSFVWPLNSLFMHDVLGKTLTEAGLVIALQSALALSGQFLSGYLADKIGARRLMLWGLVLASLTVGLIGVFPVWSVYVPAIIFLGLTQALIFVPLNALISILWPAGERRGFNYLYVAVNAGVAIGTALGGLVAQYSFRLVFLSNAVTFLLYLVVVLYGIPKDVQPGQDRVETKFNWHGIVSDFGFKTLVSLCLGIFFVWTAYIQMTTILPIVMTNRGFSLASYSVLWTINGACIVLLQPLVSWAIRVWVYTFPRQFLVGSGLMVGAFVILLRISAYQGYVVSIILLTLGEMLILPAVPTVAARLAPPGREGLYQGAVAGMASGGRMMGPLLGGALFDRGGGSATWYLAVGFLLGAMMVFLLYRSHENILARQINIGA